MSNHRITDNLESLLGILPSQITEAVSTAGNKDDLIEVILDLGRVPTARFTNGEVELSTEEIKQADINNVVKRIGEFDDDNRAGIERTLHRIAAIRNRTGDVVGLTCRVGRAVYGTTEIIRDLIESGKSLLFLGRPGVGKTTMLREAARILAENRRVVIVDTSNEIGGDGDVPHPAIGKARRMQVAASSLQHEVMIEAVENHNPEVIVIDEIGRELEALAARTIAERGVQLIGTAHGHTLENLLINPTLSDLIGGIEAVTLSDEEARRRGTQKTVLERRSHPTFHVLIEIQTRDRLAIHEDVAAAVDSVVRGGLLAPEIRSRSENGEIKIQRSPVQLKLAKSPQGFKRQSNYQPPVFQEEKPQAKLEKINIFPYGIARSRLEKAAKQLEVPLELQRKIQDADVVVTLKHHYRDNPKALKEAEELGLPIYVLRSNTAQRMERFLRDIFNLETNSLSQDEEMALQQTQGAIQAVLGGEQWIELPPANPHIRSLQHQMARQANLTSHSYGKDPNRRVRIFQE